MLWRDGALTFESESRPRHAAARCHARLLASMLAPRVVTMLTAMPSMLRTDGLSDRGDRQMEAILARAGNPNMPGSERFISPKKVTRTLVVAGCGLIVFATLANAHDFWLVPNAFTIAPGSYVEVRGQTSSQFPISESAVTVDRVADARLLSATGSATISELSVRGKSLVLRQRPDGTGQRVVAVTLHPRSVRESVAGFRRYLELEGAPDALSRVDREGLLVGRDSVTRRYAKYAKTIVEVGTGASRAFSRVAGHPLELMPEQDPSALAVGDTLTILVGFDGRPLAGARLHAGFVPMPGGQPDIAAVRSDPDQHVVTDSEGRARVPLARQGLWNVRMIHVGEAAPNSGADWDTHWATLVFRVGKEDLRGPSRPR